MEIKIQTKSGKMFEVDSETLEKIGRENMLTFLSRRFSHREIRAGGFAPTDTEISSLASRLKLAEQFLRFGDSGYRDMEMRVFEGHHISEGMARRLMEIQETDVSDVDFRALALAQLRENWEFDSRLANVEPEQFFRRQLRPDEYCEKCGWHNTIHHSACVNLRTVSR